LKKLYIPIFLFIFFGEDKNHTLNLQKLQVGQKVKRIGKLKNFAQKQKAKEVFLK
jgi:hypothetical protein